MELKGPTRHLGKLIAYSMTIGPGQGEGSILTGADQLFILKEGSLDAVLNDQEPKHLGPGGICLLLAGDRVQFSAGDTAAVLYRCTFFVRNVPFSDLNYHTSILADWSDLKRKSGIRDIFKEPTRFLGNVNMRVITLRGRNHPAVNGTEEIILVSRGKIRVQVGDKTLDASTGDLVYVPSGVVCGLRNTGNATAQYFEIQWR